MRPDVIDNVENRTAIHIPWWKFYVPEPSFILPVNAIASNRALAEMQKNSLKYVARLSHLLLRIKPPAKKDELRCMFVENFGSSQITGISIEQADEILRQAGFSLSSTDPWAVVYTAHLDNDGFSQNKNVKIIASMVEAEQDRIALNDQYTATDIVNASLEHSDQIGQFTDDEKFLRFLNGDGNLPPFFQNKWV